MIEYFAAHHPNWQPIQFCGYHIRDAGGNVVQEVAVALANGIAYIEEAARRGVCIADIAPTLFFFLSSSIDIFEEAAKFRAARRIWAKLLHGRYGVPHKLCSMKIFAYTLGGALVAQEPQNNITRIAYEALAAVLWRCANFGDIILGRSAQPALRGSGPSFPARATDPGA